MVDQSRSALIEFTQPQQSIVLGFGALKIEIAHGHWFWLLTVILGWSTGELLAELDQTQHKL